jgi:hypothetical protein
MLHLAQEMAAAEAALQPHVQAATAAAAGVAGAEGAAEASELSPEAMQLTAVLLPPGLLLLRLARHVSDCADTLVGGLEKRVDIIQACYRSLHAFNDVFGSCSGSLVKAAFKDDDSPWGCWLGSNRALVSTRV